METKIVAEVYQHLVVSIHLHVSLSFSIVFSVKRDLIKESHVFFVSLSFSIERSSCSLYICIKLILSLFVKESNTMSKPTGTNSIVASRINNLFNAGQTESQDPQRSPPNNKQSSDHLTRFQSAKALFAKMEEEILSKTSTSPTNLTQRPSNVSNYFAKQANSTARRSLNSYGLNSFSSTSNGVSTTSPAAITSRRPLGTSHTTSDDTGHHQYKLSKNTSESALNSSSRIPITSNSASNKTTTSPPISLSSRSSSESLLAPNTGHQNVNTNGYCTSTATVTLSPVSSSSANKSWSKLNAVASSNTNNIKYEPQPSPSTPVISENSNRLLIVSNSNEDNESSTEPSLSSSSENPSNGDIKSHATNYYQKSNDYHCPQVIKSDLAGYLHNYNSDRLPNSGKLNYHLNVSVFFTLTYFRLDSKRIYHERDEEKCA